VPIVSEEMLALSARTDERLQESDGARVAARRTLSPREPPPLLVIWRPVIACRTADRPERRRSRESSIATSIGVPRKACISRVVDPKARPVSASVEETWRRVDRAQESPGCVSVEVLDVTRRAGVGRYASPDAGRRTE